MSSSDFDLFKYLAKLTTEELKRAAIAVLKEYNYQPKIFPHAITAEGTIPIAVVAHLDTVFERKPSKFYFDPKREIIWDPAGLGADDRLGVMLIFQLLTKGLRPHIILTCDEETYGYGSDEIAKQEPFEDLRYIIELDRAGQKDCVFYSCDNPYFINYIESFGFQEAIGTYTDISTICPAWGVAGVNLSIGYYNEHQNSEYIKMQDYRATRKKVLRMLQVPRTEIPTFEYIPAKNYRYHCSYCNSVFYVQDLIFFDNTNFPLCICKKCAQNLRVENEVD